jgi:agmatinase
MSSDPEFGQPVSEEARPRFTGLRTFMQLPAASDPAGYGVAILGAPFDTGTTYRAGARFGPAALREASSLLYGYHPRHRLDLFRVLPGADLGDVAVVPGEVGESLSRIEAGVSRVLAAGAVPILLGGDHTVALAELRAHRSHWGQPVALIHLDSHSDLWDQFWGVRYNHGTPFRRAWEEGLFDPAASAQVGLRGSVTHLEDMTQGRDLGLMVVTCEEWFDAGIVATARRVAERVGDRPVVLSLDVDVVDPAFAPGTGTPEVGGPTSREVMAFLRALAGIRLVGADVVEVCPPYDHGEVTSLLGATLAWEEIGLAAVARSRVGAGRAGAP